MSEADVERIMAVMDAAFDPAFGEAWTRRQVLDALDLGRCRHALIDAAGATPAPGARAAGFALSRDGFEEEELLLLAVDPACRRRGLGSAILAALARGARGRGARRLLLEMRRGNPARSLYERFGFAPVGERRDYYRAAGGDRLDAITFALDLDPRFRVVRPLDAAGPLL